MDSLVFWFILAVLAVWRVAHALAYEDGPGNILLKIRLLSGARWQQDLQPTGTIEGQWYSDGFWGALLVCPLCMSIWLSAPLAIWLFGLTPQAFIGWMAMSGGASALEIFLEP